MARKNGRDELRKLVIFGCGNYARHHLRAIKKYGEWFEVAAVVDLAEKKGQVLAVFKGIGLPEPRFISHTEYEGKLAKFTDICGTVISTYGPSHREYVEWSLNRGLHTLVDKPLTLAPHCSLMPSRAMQLWRDYKELVAKAKRIEREDGKPHIFALATQRRYQKLTREILSKVNSVYEETGVPITVLQALTNDGYWLSRKGYLECRSYAPEVSCGGKLVHTGYHVIDILAVLLRTDRQIDNATIQVSTFNPSDAIAMLDSPPVTAEEEELSEINVVAQISFRQGKRMRCQTQLALLHEGLSRQAWPIDGSPQDMMTTAGAGRTKQDLLTFYQGTLRTMMARRFAKIPGKSSKALGGRDHLEVIWADNPAVLTGRSPLTRKNWVYDECDEEPCRDFLKSILLGQNCELSPVQDHAASIKLFSHILKACSTGTEQVSFSKTEWLPPLIRDSAH